MQGRAVASQTGWQGDKRSNASCTLATSLFDPSQWLAGAGGDIGVGGGAGGEFLYFEWGGGGGS